MISSNDEPADIEELSESEVSDLEDKLDSHIWYSEHGWTQQAAKTKAELEAELGEFDDVAELEAIFDQREDITKTEREQEIEECKERINWYESHDWKKAAESEYDRLRELKEG